MVARHGVLEHLIYDRDVRQLSHFLVGALAFIALTAAATALAQTDPTTPPTPTTTTSTTARNTTTSPPPVNTTSPPTTRPTGKTTTTTTNTTTTTIKGAGQPVPPPASGASQPLDPTIVGGTPIVTFNPSTTLFGVETVTVPTTVATDVTALQVSHSSNGPSGVTLALATVAWLASLGGLLVYAEDQRGKRWRHLAR